MKARFAAAAAAMLISACSKPVPVPVHEIRVPTPRAWQSGETAPGAPSGDWWAYVDDPGLDKGIRQALNCNPTLQAAAARIDVAMQERVVAGSAKLPEVGLGTNRTHQRQNFVGLPFPGLADRVLSNTFSNAGMALNVSWEADLWHRVGARKLAADADIAGREADLAAARLSLSGQVAKAWFAATEAERQVTLATDLVRHLETVEERMRERYRAGSRSPLDVRLANGDVLRAQATVHQMRQARDAAVRQIEALACSYPSGSKRVTGTLPRIPEQVPAGLPSELVHRRPDLVSAERALLAADARIVESKATLLPSFALTSAIGTSSNTLLDVVNPSLRIWNYAFAFAQPIFNRGRLRAGLQATQARGREATANYESLAWNAYREVETALAAEETLRHQEDALRAAQISTTDAMSLAQDRYRAGLSDVFTALAMQRTALETESALLGLHRARIDNRVDLHLALGGDFEGPKSSSDIPDGARQGELK